MVIFTKIELIAAGSQRFKPRGTRYRTERPGKIFCGPSKENPTVLFCYYTTRLLVFTVMVSGLDMSPVQQVWLKIILQGTVKGRRKQGRQSKRWEDNIREWTVLEFVKSQRAVENRGKWRKLVAKSSMVPQ